MYEYDLSACMTHTHTHTCIWEQRIEYWAGSGCILEIYVGTLGGKLVVPVLRARRCTHSCVAVGGRKAVGQSVVGPEPPVDRLVWRSRHLQTPTSPNPPTSSRLTGLWPRTLREPPPPPPLPSLPTQLTSSWFLYPLSLCFCILFCFTVTCIYLALFFSCRLHYTSSSSRPANRYIARALSVSVSVSICLRLSNDQLPFIAVCDFIFFTPIEYIRTRERNVCPKLELI